MFSNVNLFAYRNEQRKQTRILIISRNITTVITNTITNVTLERGDSGRKSI